MERKYITKASELLDELQLFGDKLSIDTETTDLRYDKLELEGFSMCNGERAFYVDYVNSLEKDELINTLKQFFHNKGKGKFIYVQNAVFDMKVLYKYGVSLENAKMFDTMVADHLIDERLEHGLKKMAKRYLGVDDTMDYETARRYGSSSKQFVEYATNDAIWTYQIAEDQMFKLEKHGVLNLMLRIEVPYTQVLFQMHIEGMLVDMEELERQRELAKEHIFNMKIQLLRMLKKPYILQGNLANQGLEVVSDFNLNSTQMICKVLYDDLGLPVYETTPAGSPSAGSSALKQLKDKHEFPALLLNYRGLVKLYDAFIEPLPNYIQNDGRVRSDYHVARAKTGRLSCSNINMQQLPNEDKGEMYDLEIRKVFVAPKGYKMLACDYSGQENKVLAQVSQDEEFIKLLRGGFDLHLANANAFFDLGIPEEKLSERHPEYKKIRKEYENVRKKAKSITFGVAYGKGPMGFAKDFGISEDEAQRRLDKFFNKFKGIKQSMDKTHAEVDRVGFVRSLTGRKRRFYKEKNHNGDEYYSNASKRQSFNFLIQGMSADMIKIASIKTLNLARKHPEWGLKQVATVHDENVYIVKEEYVDIASKGIKGCFESAVNFVVPMDVDVGIGDNYSQAK